MRTRRESTGRAMYCTVQRFLPGGRYLPLDRREADVRLHSSMQQMNLIDSAWWGTNGLIWGRNLWNLLDFLFISSTDLWWLVSLSPFTTFVVSPLIPCTEPTNPIVHCVVSQSVSGGYDHQYNTIRKVTISAQLLVISQTGTIQRKNLQANIEAKAAFWRLSDRHLLRCLRISGQLILAAWKTYSAAKQGEIIHNYWPALSYTQVHTPPPTL